MIIQLNGCNGAGKDTIGEILVRNHGFTRFAYADHLKEMYLEMHPEIENLELAKRKIPEVRQGLIDLARTIRKFVRDDYFANIVKEKIIASKAKDFVITDCRFDKELEIVGGLLVRVVRSGYEDGSEFLIERCAYTTLYNNRSKELLASCVARFLVFDRQHYLSNEVIKH